MRNLQVNGERLWASLMELAEIGATPRGGVCRLAEPDWNDGCTIVRVVAADVQCPDC